MIIKKAFAVKEDLGRLKGIGKIGLPGDPSQAVEVFTGILSGIIGVMTIAAAIWFLINIIIAAYQYMSAGGDSQKVKEAQQKIQNSILGLFITVAAIFLLSLMGTILDIPFLDLGELINRTAF